MSKLLMLTGFIIVCCLVIFNLAKPNEFYNELTENITTPQAQEVLTPSLLPNVLSTDENDSSNYPNNIGEKTSIDSVQLIRIEESKNAFLQAYTVFMHPRCMNCHPIGDIPLQGDDSHLHTQGVTRGVDGTGLYANKCSNCHQPIHIDGPHLPPGHENWHLPPAHRKMTFEGKSPRELAAGFKDSTFTGFSSVERIIEHVENDHLVQNSFTYGTRPPLTHAEFVAKVTEWIEKGAELPDK